MRKHIIGGVCAILLLLPTQGAAQQPSAAPPQRTPQVPAQKTAPRPPTPPATSPYCTFESKEYSIGAVLCVSSQMSQVCTASDGEHSRPWWSSGPQTLCAADRSELPTRSPDLPPIPRTELPTPKTEFPMPKTEFPKTEP